MATLLIDTGILDSINTDPEYVENRGYSPLERVIYPEKYDGLPTLILVREGTKVVLTAYDIIGDDDISVQKVLLGDFDYEVIHDCEYMTPKKVDLNIISRADIPNWVLSNNKPILVVDIPGFYTLSLGNSNATVTCVTHNTLDYEYTNLRG